MLLSESVRTDKCLLGMQVSPCRVVQKQGADVARTCFDRSPVRDVAMINPKGSTVDCAMESKGVV